MTPTVRWPALALLLGGFALAGCGDNGSASSPEEPVPDTIPPAVPVHVRFDASEPGALYVFWQENSEPDLAGYVLQRSLDDGQSWVIVADTLLSVASYRDTFRNRVDYRVAAVDLSQNQSGFSAKVTFLAPPGGKIPTRPFEP
jgi:hypothetical protein